MKYAIEKSEKYTVLALDEDKLDTLIAPKLKSEFVTLFQSGTTNLIFDMSKIKYVDSSGLSAILAANRMAKEVNGFMALAAVSDHVIKLMNITKLDAVFNMLPTRDEAIEAAILHAIERELNGQS